MEDALRLYQLVIANCLMTATCGLVVYVLYLYLLLRIPLGGKETPHDSTKRDQP